ncbi:MAG: hypothetical protein HKN72_13135 [Gemmatimonadetes bacterium]|nr:hypothetical protein [Gemmatimonadota bacterium]
MKSYVHIASLLVLVAWGCSPAADDSTTTQSPAAIASQSMDQETRRVPQFDNEHVEVWKSIIVPNQPLEMHRHDNPRAIIAIKGGTLTVTNDAGESHDMTWETGSAYWLDADPPGELHGDVNEGSEPIEVIVVQLKNVEGD